MFKYQKIRDFTSKIMFRRNYIFNKVKTCFERYSYTPIETPAMENIETLTGKYGDEGDRLILKFLILEIFCQNLILMKILHQNLYQKKLQTRLLDMI